MQNLMLYFQLTNFKFSNFLKILLVVVVYLVWLYIYIYIYILNISTIAVQVIYKLGF